MNICISDAYSISTNCAHSVHICMFYAYIFFLISAIRGSVADVVKHAAVLLPRPQKGSQGSCGPLGRQTQTPMR